MLQRVITLYTHCSTRVGALSWGRVSGSKAQTWMLLVSVARSASTSSLEMHGSASWGASLLAEMVKHLPAMQETQVRDPWVQKIPWRRTWQPTPVFLPGEFHGQWSLAGYSPRGHTESDVTEVTRHTSPATPQTPQVLSFLQVATTCHSAFNVILPYHGALVFVIV